mgnify:CR=1 FL=1
MDDSLQNAKPLRECGHKELLVSRDSWIMIDANGLEFKICHNCYCQKYRRLLGLTFKHCPLPESITIGGITLRRMVK